MTKNLVIEVGENTELPGIIDASAKNLAKKAKDYFSISIDRSRITKVYTIQGEITEEELSLILEKIFKDPTKKVVVNSSFTANFTFAIWWGRKIGVKDTEGEVAKEAIEEILGRKIGNVSASQVLYLEELQLLKQEMKLISLFANPNVDRWEVIPRKKWDLKNGIGPRISEVKINKKPRFRFMDLNIPTDEFVVLNNKNNWALGISDFEFLKKYLYNNSKFQEIRAKLGLTNITDVEIECLAQVWSDHCSHRTFHGNYSYLDEYTGQAYNIDDPFDVFIKAPTNAIAKASPWVVSVLNDNAGTMNLDREGKDIVGIKIETHNSPTWKDPYGGTLTGVVGVDRDPLGTGRWGLKIIADLCSFSLASRDYYGCLFPEIHPLQIHDGMIAGIRDGGNKHGFPTIRHKTYFDESYLGKGHVFAGAIGISPRVMLGRNFEDKTANPGDLVVIIGGRTGIDGIHGVTEASMGLTDKTTMGHVQKGDPYLQRKVSELFEDAKALGIFNLVWDLGGGGISSLVTETARFSNGIEIHLENVLLKYQGLDWWQILVSESQERMHAAISPENIEEFIELAKLHDVEFSVIGKYTASGAVHILAENKTCAWLPLALLHDDPPQWKFKAVWVRPEQRLYEPVISEPKDYNSLIKAVLDHENICSTEWIMHQFDFRVKGQTVVPPLIGKNENVECSASVIRPILGQEEAIAISDAVNPRQSIIDTYWMTINIFDEAIRSIAAVSGVNFKNSKPERIGLLDNFCWPDILPGSNNPDAEYKAAQLIRSLEALRDVQKKCQIPLLSGKDSMYIRGDVEGKFGEKHTIFGLPCIQGTVIASTDNAGKCLMPKLERVDDIICVVGPTKNELGASIFYQLLGYVGLNIPKPDITETMKNVRAVSESIEAEILTSAQPIVKGGFITALAKMAIAGDLGANIDLRKMSLDNVSKNSQAMLSESGERFILTFNPCRQHDVEKIMNKYNCTFRIVGTVTDKKTLNVTGLEGAEIINEKIKNLEIAYTQRFGDLI